MMRLGTSFSDRDGAARLIQGAWRDYKIRCRRNDSAMAATYARQESARLLGVAQQHNYIRALTAPVLEYKRAAADMLAMEIEALEDEYHRASMNREDALQRAAQLHQTALQHDALQAADASYPRKRGSLARGGQPLSKKGRCTEPVPAALTSQAQVPAGLLDRASFPACPTLSIPTTTPATLQPAMALGGSSNPLFRSKPCRFNYSYYLSAARDKPNTGTLTRLVISHPQWGAYYQHDLSSAASPEQLSHAWSEHPGKCRVFDDLFSLRQQSCKRARMYLHWHKALFRAAQEPAYVTPVPQRITAPGDGAMTDATYYPWHVAAGPTQAMTAAPGRRW